MYLLAIVISLGWQQQVAVGVYLAVGGGLVFAALTDWCGMGLLLAKAPWNRARRGERCGGTCKTAKA